MNKREGRFFGIMADVFKRFISNLTSTGLTTVFTVPTADVAASPAVPESTFVVKSLSVTIIFMPQTQLL